jgi:hypothetical protein
MRIAHPRRIIRGFSLLLAAMLLVILPSIASGVSQPVFKPTLEIIETTASIDVDGQLNDAGWKSAARVDNFVETYPGDNTEPEVKTAVFVTYDDRSFYVAFICQDDPKGIRATMCQRDQYGGDDVVTVLIDPYASASWAYMLRVNPYGIQKDMLWTPIIGGDLGHDMIWESAATVTDSGWQAEIAIPFSSLRFPSKDIQTWRMDFERIRQREITKTYTWAAKDRNEQCFPCQFGTLTGIADVRPGKGIGIMPTMVAHQSGKITDLRNPNSAFHNANPEGEFSLGAKYAINSDVIVEATANPDFSQIEADAAQIDVNSTVSLFYPERRPFFQEGSDIFRTLFNSFYTRTVNDPQLAAKLTGRMGKTTLGYVGARDMNTPYMIPLEEGSILLNTGKSTVNVLRGLRTFGSDSRVGILLSDRRFEHDGSGTVAALDCDIRLSKNYSIDGQYILTHTAEPQDSARTARYGRFGFDGDKHTVAFDGESYTGTAFITRLKRQARNWGFIIDYNQVSPSYRTEVGYDPLMDYRNLALNSNYTFYPRSSAISRITPGFYASRRWTFDGARRNSVLFGGLDAQFSKAQTYTSINVGSTSELYNSMEFTDLWQVSFNWDSRISNQIGLGAGFSRGVNVVYFALAKGNMTSYFASLNLKPIDRLVIQPSINFARSTDRNTGEKFYSGYITRTRILYQANRELSFRLVVQYDDFNRAWGIEPLMTYRLSPFSVFYFGSANDYYDLAPDVNSKSQWRLASRQFFMKIQYLFQT